MNTQRNEITAQLQSQEQVIAGDSIHCINVFVGLLTSSWSCEYHKRKFASKRHWSHAQLGLALCNKNLPNCYSPVFTPWVSFKVLLMLYVYFYIITTSIGCPYMVTKPLAAPLFGVLAQVLLFWALLCCLPSQRWVITFCRPVSMIQFSISHAHSTSKIGENGLFVIEKFVLLHYQANPMLRVQDLNGEV